MIQTRIQGLFTVPDSVPGRGGTPRIRVGYILKFAHTADTHLGFEFMRMGPSELGGRKRRAEPIFSHFMSVAKYATDIEADLFVHNGDLFNK